jgi:carbon-monoxide dehydrogenase medium subunit
VKNVVDISGIKELNYIEDRGDHVAIGAATKLQDIVDSPVIAAKVPVLAEAVNEMASWQVRNVATIGGNLCNASPAADTAPPLLVLNARLRLVSLEGEREVPMTGFFLGPRKTVLRKGELLKEIVVPYERGAGASFIKLGRRNAFTLSVVAVATLVKVRNGIFDDVRVALNSVAPKPVRAVSVEKFLKSREISMSAIEEGAKRVLQDISPISDVRASADYRKEMSVVLTKESLLKSLERAGVKL